ncbi:hypothetical protein COB21_03220 [Candidatus Aerophobetes bacterium]|uniref:Uncharacterized protein n=1 Tax=Aerophobetes bacterium TaxID=2030807 RepID=A0A2A4X4Q8_UNCAE|nr:MAG: hypothetical protein COB21_03220 [Candidatus Aerophobetes bacterium]
MLLRVIAVIAVFYTSLFYGANNCPYTTFNTQHKKNAIRIFQLLPGLGKMLPLVDPCLPAEFIAITEEDSEGRLQYYWGERKHLDAYKEDPSKLTGMLVKVSLPSNFSQMGHDRFNIDTNYAKWMASGFGQILVNKGKWGIFPTREIRMQCPKKRAHYKLCVGLNDESKQVLVFELMYPVYLKSPAQVHLKIWKDFITKTALLNHSELMVARGQSVHKGYTDVRGVSEVVRFKAQKRLSDNRVFLQIFTPNSANMVVDVQSAKDRPALYGDIVSPGYLDIDMTLIEKQHRGVRKTIQVYYDYCDAFVFSSELLSPGLFLKKPNSQVVIFQN